jgi:hypothetical protein
MSAFHPSATTEWTPQDVSNVPISDIVRNMARLRVKRRVEQTASDGGRARGAQKLGDSLPAALRIEWVNLEKS